MLPTSDIISLTLFVHPGLLIATGIVLLFEARMLVHQMAPEAMRRAWAAPTQWRQRHLAFVASSYVWLVGFVGYLRLGYQSYLLPDTDFGPGAATSLGAILSGVVGSIGAAIACRVISRGYGSIDQRSCLLVSGVVSSWMLTIVCAVLGLGSRELGAPSLVEGLFIMVARAGIGLGAIAQLAGMAWLGYRVYRVVRLGPDAS